MAKFRIKPALIPKLGSAGFLNAEGKMVLRIPYKENLLTGESRYEVQFLPTVILETTNAFAIRVLERHRPPRISTSTGWLVGDPSVSMFETVPDNDTNPTLVIDLNGVETVTKKEQVLLDKYQRATKVNVPKGPEKTTLQPYLDAAKNHNFR